MISGLQEKLLELLCEIDEICRKYGIKYCLFAGSGLGADRHGGFIPWDDDADIIMTLENYEKFLKAFDSEAKKDRVLNCLENSTDYPFTYARYVDITTTAIQRHTAFGGCDPGVKVDIFVVVPTHSELEKAERHRLEILAFSEIICPYAIMYSFRPEGFAEAYQIERKMYDKLGREKYIKKRLKKLKYYKKKRTGRYVLFSGMMSNSYILDGDIIDEIKYVKFENTQLPISKNNIKFSKEIFGEGWISKPKNVDVPRHTFLLDLNKPYKKYIDSLWEIYDFNEAESTVADRKKMHMLGRDDFKDVAVNNQNLKNLAIEMGMNNAFDNILDEDKENWQYLYDLFEEYYSTQLKGINKHYELFIDLNSEVFEAAMNAAIMMDRYYEAADIISIGLKSNVLSYTDKVLETLRDRIDICREITETMYIKKDFVKLQKTINDLSDDMIKESLTVKIAELWMQTISSGDDELSQICDMVDHYSDTYGEVGELLAVKGYCLECKGMSEEAANIYSSAANNVRNGYLYQWLADKGYSTYEYKYE